MEKKLEKKPDAIKVPTNITELRSFLGVAQQMAKFSRKLPHAVELLRDLLSSTSV